MEEEEEEKWAGWAGAQVKGAAVGTGQAGGLAGKAGERTGARNEVLASLSQGWGSCLLSRDPTLELQARVIGRQEGLPLQTAAGRAPS